MPDIVLTNFLERPESPARIVVIGAAGFVGAAAVKRLGENGCSVLPLGRSDVDLLSVDAGGVLAKLLKPQDAVLVVSAKAPAKTNADVIANMRMMAAVCDAIASTPVAHIVYVSSDAVYADSDFPLTELSCAQPASLHGAMHLTREVMLANAYRGPLCILRPTLIYGAADPHNGYGPNRFMRLAMKGESIDLFGEGEERRDHVSIDDVAELIWRVFAHRSSGILNVATGQVASFREIADAACALFPTKAVVRGTPRNGPMPHRGYRSFDVKATGQAFSDFRYRPLAIGLERMRVDLIDGRGLRPDGNEYRSGRS